MKSQLFFTILIMYLAFSVHAQSSLKLKPFVSAGQGYCSLGMFSKPNVKGAYHLRSRPHIYFPIGAFLEYNFNRHSAIQAGIMANEKIITSTKIEIWFNNCQIPMYHYASMKALKFPLLYCTELFRRKQATGNDADKKYNSFKMLAGMSIIKASFYNNAPDGLQLYSTSITYSDTDSLYIPYSVYKGKYSVGFSFNLGFNYSIINKKGTELMQLSAYYEKGLRTLAYHTISFQRKNDYEYFNKAISRGTTFHLTVAMPITLKRFYSLKDKAAFQSH